MVLFLAYLVLLAFTVSMWARRSVWKRTFFWSLIAVAYIFAIRLIAAIAIGVPSSGVIFFTLPEIHLPNWMAGIHLGGSVTRQRLSATISDTYVIGAIIATFGAINAFLSPKKILAAIPKRARAISTSIVIALNAYPQLIISISRIKRAQHLRSGKKISWAKLAHAMLEDAVKRSLLVAESLFIRGYEKKIETTPSSDSVVVRNLFFAFEEGQPEILAEISLDIGPGTLTVITGDTGSGKTTLLKILAGIIPETTGGILSGVRTITSTYPYLPQNPRDAFVTDSVRQEIAFALEIQNVDPSNIEDQVSLIATRMGLSHLLNRDINELSGGESQKVALAALLISRPKYLFLDEPTSEMDGYGIDNLISIIEDLVASGTACVISEHRNLAFKSLRPAIYQLNRSRLVKSSTQTFPNLEATQKSQIKCIVGENGSGKTTYLNSLIGSDFPGYLPQNPAELFFGSSIASECVINDRDWNLPPNTTSNHLQSFGDFDLQMHPADLSEGQRLLVALAIVTARSPQRILLDEPTRGLDFSKKKMLVEQLRTLSLQSDITVATHDHEFARALTTSITEVSHVAK